MREIERRFLMTEKEKQITVSVRLCETEYKALQAEAQKEYTTMSGLLRKLLHGHLKGVKYDG